MLRFMHYVINMTKKKDKLFIWSGILLIVFGTLTWYYIPSSALLSIIGIFVGTGLWAYADYNEKLLW